MTEKCVCVFAAYFEGLVFHFHDELLLLFLSGAGFLELGLDVVDLHLILHNCGEQQEVHVTIIKTLTSFTLLLSYTAESREKKPERDGDVT